MQNGAGFGDGQDAAQETDRVAGHLGRQRDGHATSRLLPGLARKDQKLAFTLDRQGDPFGVGRKAPGQSARLAVGGRGKNDARRIQVGAADGLPAEGADGILAFLEANGAGLGSGLFAGLCGGRSAATDGLQFGDRRAEGGLGLAIEAADVGQGLGHLFGIVRAGAFLAALERTDQGPARMQAEQQVEVDEHLGRGRTLGLAGEQQRWSRLISHQLHD